MAITPNLGLHQWEPGDPFLRGDFNEDFCKLDTAVQKAVPLVGTFTGDGADNRNILLGFKPSLLLLQALWMEDYPVVALLTETRCSIVCSVTPDIVRHQTPGLTADTAGILLTDDGFQTGRAADFNSQGRVQVYIAFH